MHSAGAAVDANTTVKGQWKKFVPLREKEAKSNAAHRSGRIDAAADRIPPILH